MNGVIYLNYSGLLYTILLLFCFFLKKRTKNKEQKIYGYLIIVSLLELVFGVIASYAIYYNFTKMIMEISTKLYFITILLWIYIFTYYIILITSEKAVKFYGTILSIIMVTSAILLTILPLNFVLDNDLLYSSGICLYVAYGSTLIYLIFCIAFGIKGIKKINKKYIPLWIFLAIGTVCMIIQYYNPQMFLIVPLEVFVTSIMYHTIENPDVKMIEQLNIAKATAEKANRAKSDFLSSMSHEIRTPLNAIVGFSEMIENENTIEGCKENAKDIVLASHTLLEIVNGILDISKIEANKMEIVNKEYSLLPELNNLAKLMIPRIGEKPIELKTQFAEDIPAVMYGDIGKIKQIITNILTNACKYTEKGEINFNVNCINEKDICSLVISVEDTGRGIKPDKIDSLFTKFNRLEEDRNTTIEGTGLGLAITKQLTEMMGGKIVVQSVYGKGSKFTIYLKQKIVEKEGTIESETKEEENVNFAGFKVLVVDDNKLNLKVADKLLKTYALSTVLVESGMECIDLIKKGEKFDLILMDDMMPRLRGPEVLIRLKQIPNFTIPTIALTANATTGIKESYLKDGFDDYLAKPIERIELINVLKKYLTKKDVKENNLDNQSKEINNSNKIKVLIVDDNKINIKIASNMMGDYGFEIEGSLSGEECIEKAKNNHYDLIFMDYMMPTMDGIETLKHLKEIPNFNTTAIALTADAVDGSREKFLHAGFDEYVSKPINKKALDEVIQKMLNKNANIKKTSSKEIDKVSYLKENGIDVDHGLKLLGDMEMYNETLQVFMEGLNERFNKIKSYKENNDMDNYAVEVHSLKSDSKYLGFMKLAEIAYNHEMKSKANDIAYVNANYNELVTETKKIFDIVKKYFN